jgi:photosystem II stability/assembly factor-like uncharacterized protein
VRISGGTAAGAALASAIVASGPGAAANGRYPSSTQIVFSSAAPETGPIVVRTTYGLLVSRDGGSSWRWICEAALGVPAVSIEDPSVALGADDSLVVGLAEGLDESHDLGCNFACSPGALVGRAIVDLAGGPGPLVALSSAHVFDDAGNGASLDTRVWRSDGDGDAWVQIGGALDPTVTATTIDVARGDPRRLYVSGTRGYGSALTASLFVSTDGGASWIERPVPLDASSEFGIFIGAVDPDVPDRVYLRSTGASRLYVTDDAGQSFRVPIAFVGPMMGLALSPDGALVYVGGPEDGLFVASTAGLADAGFTFRHVSSAPVQCLATRGVELWACTDVASGFSVGVSIDGGTWVPKLVPGGLAGPVDCAPSPAGPFACQADANVSQCAGEAFTAECTALGGCPPLLADAGAVEKTSPGFTGCGCDEAGRAGAGGIAAVVGLGASWAMRRHRRLEMRRHRRVGEKRRRSD